MPEDLQLVINAKAGLATLLAYDSAWTCYVNDASLAKDHPYSMFETALAFRNALLSAPEHADHIAGVAEQRFGEVSGSLMETLSNDEIGLVTIEALERHDKNVAVLARIGADDMRESSHEEADRLDADARDVVAGQSAQGYLGDRFLCGLAKVSMAAGLITVWVPPHAHGACQAR